MLFFIALLRRIGWAVVTLWGVSLIVFCLLFVAPRLHQKDPTTAMAMTMAGAHATPEVIANIKHRYGLDLPLYTQYYRYMSDVLTNHLISYRNKEPVMSAIARRFPATLLLALTALFVYLVVAVPVGLLTASHDGQFIDRGVLVLCLFAISMPTFWLGQVLQHYLGYEWGLFGLGGNASLANLPLPALTLGIGGAAYYSRLLHSNLRGVLKLDYIRAARARGLSERMLLLKHALKNALIPVVTILGLEFASLLSGLIFTEKIFAWPGIGSLAVDSVLNQDNPMIMGTVMFSALMVVVANILIDLAYHLIDPRVRFD